jgi:hypothetical protein
MTFVVKKPHNNKDKQGKGNVHRTQPPTHPGHPVGTKHKPGGVDIYIFLTLNIQYSQNKVFN